jgi:hypothetical protein
LIAPVLVPAAMVGLSAAVYYFRSKTVGEGPVQY